MSSPSSLHPTTATVAETKQQSWRSTKNYRTACASRFFISAPMTLITAPSAYNSTLRREPASPLFLDVYRIISL